MTTKSRYVRPQGEGVAAPQPHTFRWEYDDGRAELLALYGKGKRPPWDARQRIDWSLELDSHNPMQRPEETITLVVSDIWSKLSAKDVVNFRRDSQAWHLICTARIVQQVQNIDAKFYAATQVIDEARDSAAMLAEDNRVAEEFGAKRMVAQALAS